jgi:N-acetylmuramoyl-L-alanine amidase
MITVTNRRSPNHNARPAGTIIDCIVLHADASPTIAASLGYMMTRDSKVSYHYLIGRLGDVYQLVDDTQRAWHAGVSAFNGRHDCNNYSIGVSFGNLCDGHEPYRADQLHAGVLLCARLIKHWPAITVERITTHAHVALPAGRKYDPGPRFPLSDFLADVAREIET